MKNVDDIANPRQVNHAIPGPLILIPKLEHSGAYGRHGPIIARPITLPKLPQLKSEILPD
jgi:hypothetical protein